MNELRRPLILLSPNIRDEAPDEKIYNNDSYFRAVAAAGGIPATCGNICADMLRYTDETAGAALLSVHDYADAVADRFAGMIVTGGVDVAPARYTGEDMGKSFTDARIDVLDEALIRAFMEAGKPILGICRGIQMLNVYFGGTLIQDLEAVKGIPSSMHNMRARDPIPPNNAHAHSVTFTPGSDLFDIFGECAGVNSYHHQAVMDTAKGFAVTGISEDGIVEGMESDAQISDPEGRLFPQVTAVQWHPERMINEPAQLELFARFVRRCR